MLCKHETALQETILATDSQADASILVLRRGLIGLATRSQETRLISGVRLFNGQDAVVDGLEVWVGDETDSRRNQVQLCSAMQACPNRGHLDSAQHS